MDSVTISTVANQLVVTAPYNPAFPPEAKTLGGKWSARDKAWVFDARDEERVRELVRSKYGSDGSDSDEPGVTVRVVLHELDRDARNQQTVALAGQIIAERRSRDEAVRLPRGVVLIEGQFQGSGGSVRYPALDKLDGVVVEVRDLPRAAAAKAIADHPDAVTLVDAAAIDLVALRAERETLAARLAELDALLAAAEA